MNFLTRLAVAALALVLASPSIAANDVVYINGLPLFVSTINSGAVQAVAVYTPANAPLSVATPVPTTLNNVPATLSTSAAALPSQALVNGLTCYPSSANTGTNYWGGTGLTTSNGVPMLPGKPFAVATNNANVVYILGTNTTDTVRCVGN